MKRILFLLLLAITLSASSQTSLVTVNFVKPKPGQKMAFEAAYKMHIAKFHQKDEKISVWEVLSGPYSGFYHLVTGGRTYADFDKERPDAAAHSMDLDKSFFPLLEETHNSSYRFVDSLSIHSDFNGDKAIVNVRHINPQMMGDYRKELSRQIKVINKLDGKFWQVLSVNMYEEIWAGSSPVVVSVRNLKDGFQSLETDYYGPLGSSFKDEYIKQFGTADWDKRDKIMQDAVVKNEQYIMKLRKDLSSQ